MESSSNAAQMAEVEPPTAPVKKIVPLIPEHLVQTDPFESWITGQQGTPPTDSQMINENLKSLRNDAVVPQILDGIGHPTYPEPLVELLQIPTNDDLYLQAIGIRTVSQVSKVTSEISATIDDATQRNAGVTVNIMEYQSTAQTILDERESAWDGDENWMDSLEIEDENTKQELEELHQKARAEFDISALGGLSLHRDSLSSLKGIGPKLEMYLYAMGIRNFEQLSKLTPEIEARFDAIVGSFPGRLSRANVVEQSKAKLGK